MRILVLGTDARSVLAVIRSLGRAGHEIYLAGVPANSEALWSRYVRKVLPLDAYRHGDHAWMVAFEKLLEANGIDLAIPCSDPMIIPLQAVRGKIRTNSKLYLLPDDVYRVSNDKLEMHRIAQSLGIPVPRGVVVANEEALRRALRELPGPWVCKPRYSYAQEDPGKRHAVEKAYTLDKALSMGRRFLRQGVFHIQENFAGRGAGTELLCDRGEILLAFQHLRVHEPMHGGGSSYRRGMPLHAGMYEAARKIVRHLGYTGVAMLEFKWDQGRDAWVFVELNARFWGSLPLAVASGADFPRALVELLMYGRRSSDCEVRHDLYARNIELDLDWLLSNLRADKRDPYLASLPWSAVLLELLNLVRGRERWDTLAVDDPKPFLRTAARVAKGKARALARRISCSGQFLALTRSLRCRRLHRMLGDARRIGFVCYGNICRSPFAEAYARSRVAGRSFFSAGVHAETNRGSPEQAICSADAFGIDLLAHRSRPLTPEAARDADMIFVFDRENLMDMRARFPETANKTFLLSDADRGVRRAIDDPNDRGEDAFREAYTSIRQCIDALFRADAPPGT